MIHSLYLLLAHIVERTIMEGINSGEFKCIEND